ncbi:hypothetical protein HYPSUDRAFT_194404 [Hypholoma sublateritium FD-334 SS-4]|uniref:Uncharacterized protein n=1 Tax=Hypholoma sublateritium (strain FD-334 SS-4) TaxID=945553 RepID=A0A0D2LWT4_HYPSF|nr:hypothetical protein HYPSUDRAFT_194404 [Hypholoma sublateritium FD-334 SS-4]
MQAFNRATNFSVEGCYFIDNSTGRKETLSEVLVKLKNEAASGVSYDSIDRSTSPSATLPADLASDITAPGPNNNDFVYFVHSTSPANVREYGESAAKQCKDRGMLLASVFLRRLLTVFPAETKRRLVPTMAYQLAVSPRAPEALKIEILGALHLEPDLPERNLADQFDKLIVRPLVHVRDLLDPACPPLFLLDSVQNTTWDTAGAVVHELVHAVSELHRQGVDARAVITGVGYSPIIKAFQDSAKDDAATRIHALPMTAPASLASRARAFVFPALSWKYGLSEFAQRGVEVASLIGVVTGLPYLTSLLALLLLPTPFNVLAAMILPLVMVLGMTTALSIGISVVAYREMARMIWPREI